MTTIMPHEELVRKAVEWICEERAESDKPLETLIGEAGQRFNLSPKDSEFLVRFFRENKDLQD